MEEKIVEQQTKLKIKPRSAFKAFLLSLLFPGLGQVYNGQPKKGIIFLGLLLLVPLLFGLTRWAACFYGLILLYVIEITLMIYILTDSVRTAVKQKKYVLKFYNTWYYYLLIAFGIFGIAMVYNTGSVLKLQRFKIPTTSNSPTINVGDQLIADLSAYQDTDPDYGDFVVYTMSDGTFYVFRVVGLPNDNIALIDNIVSINGKPSKSTFIKETICDDRLVLEFEEEFPNGHKHLIYKFKTPYDSKTSHIENIVVPPNSYYLLGDNRDNAADSRYMGFINRDKIKGRIVYSFWSGASMKTMNVDFRGK